MERKVQAAGKAVELGDVKGGGMWMGTGVQRGVLWQRGEERWWFAVQEVLLSVSTEVWLMFLSLHHVVGLLEWIPYTAVYFEAKRVCRFGGYFPALCRDVSPYWVLSFLKNGSRGLFWVVGSVGVCFSLLRNTRGRAVLDRERNYFQKVVICWSLVTFWIPAWIKDIVGPLDLAANCVALGMASDCESVLVAGAALVFSKLTGIPLVLFMIAFPRIRTLLQVQKNVAVDTHNAVVLTGWPAKMFGALVVTHETVERVEELLHVDTQDEKWPKVRVWAYAGDKLAAYHTGLDGCVTGVTVAEVQNRVHVFDDDSLRNAMRVHARDWWKANDESMKGKAAATVLEALAYVVLSGVDERTRMDAYYRYRKRVESANGRLDGETLEDSEGDEFKDF